MSLFRRKEPAAPSCDQYTINFTTTETDKPRPCYARGRKALFHRWVNSAHPVLPRGEEPSENSRYFQFRRTEALVEFEDGTIGRIFPSNLQFVDGGDFDKYEWPPLLETDKEVLE